MKPPVVLDFETYYDKEYTLKKMTAEQYVRDPRFKAHGVSTLIEGETHWECEDIAGYLTSLDLPNRPVVMHHAHFDGLILSEIYGIHPAVFLDTLSMARAVHIGKLALGTLAEVLGLGMKDSARLFNTLGKRDLTADEMRELGEYSINDVALTNLVFEALRPHFSGKELMIIDTVVKMYTRPVLGIDGNLARATADADTARTAALLVDLNMTNTQLASNDQFAAALMALGLDPPRKISPATGQETWAFSKADKDFMALLEHDDPDVGALVAARLGVKSTITRTRAEMLAGVSTRGAWPVYLKYSGARQTHRLSGGEKANAQNLTRGSLLRKAVHAPIVLPKWLPKQKHGYTLVVCDSSNIELRVNMTLAGQWDVVEMLRNGEDLYCDFASQRYGRAITKKDKDERQYGKICHLALGYSMGWAKFVDTARLNKLIVDEVEARSTVQFYRERYHMVPAFWNRAEGALMSVADGGSPTAFDYDGLITAAYGKIVKPSGMPLRYPDLRRESVGGRQQWVFTGAHEQSGNAVTKYTYGGKIVENIVQSVARDIVCEQMLVITKRYPVVLQAHDEIVCVVPKHEAQEAAEFMVQAMSTAPAWFPKVPLAAEADWSFRYGDCK